MLQFSGSGADLTLYSSQVLFNQLQKPEQTSNTPLMLKSLFSRRGKLECMFQEKWLLSHAADNTDFALTANQKNEWQLLLFKACNDPEASYRHQFLCILLINKLFPNDQQFSIQTLLLDIYKKYKRNDPDCGQHIKTVAREWSETEINLILSNYRGWNKHFMFSDVPSKTEILGALAPYMESSQLAPYIDSVMQHFMLAPKHRNDGTDIGLLCSVAPFLSQEQVHTILNPFKKEMDTLGCDIVSALAATLSQDDLAFFVEAICNKLSMRSNPDFLNIACTTFKILAPYLKENEKGIIMETLISFRDTSNQLLWDTIASVVPTIDRAKEASFDYEHISDTDSEDGLSKMDFALVIVKTHCHTNLNRPNDPDNFLRDVCLLKSIGAVLDEHDLEISIMILNKALMRLEYQSAAASGIASLVQYLPAQSLNICAANMGGCATSHNPLVRLSACKFLAQHALKLAKNTENKALFELSFELLSNCLDDSNEEVYSTFCKAIKPLIPYLNKSQINLLAFRLHYDDKHGFYSNLMTLKLMAFLIPLPHLESANIKRFSGYLRQALSSISWEIRQAAMKTSLILTQHLNPSDAYAVIQPMGYEMELEHQILLLYSNMVDQLEEAHPELKAARPLDPERSWKSCAIL